MKSRRRPLIAGLALVSALGLFAAIAAPADAVAPLVSRGSGVVTAVNSGDALKVKSGGTTTTIRIANIQATEDRDWNPRGIRECSYSSSLSYLTKLAKGKKVILRSQSASSGSLGRPMRSVYVYNSTTKQYTDVAASMLKAGEAFYQNFSTETAHDASYQALTETAARGHRGVFNTSRCGAGPSQSIPIKMWVQWDADGDDNANRNGEFAVIENKSTTATLSLGNWILRTPAQTYYYFPSWAKVPPGGYVRVHVGSGTNTATDFYWRQSKALFPNVPSATTGGGAVYLLDPQTDFRAWFMWPCRTQCVDYVKSRVTFSKIQYNNTVESKSDLNQQYVQLKNYSSGRVYLDGHYLAISGLHFNFYARDYIEPGETITVRMGNGSSTRTVKYWNGKTGSFGPGRAVDFRNWNNIRIACKPGTVIGC